MNKGALLIAAALVAVPAIFSSAPAQTDRAKEKITRLVVYGNDPCPRGSGDEIIVCARKPENERYRIPKELREPPSSPLNESWAERATQLEYVGRTGIQSCSTVGPGGWTGCWAKMIREAREERRRAATTPP